MDTAKPKKLTAKQVVDFDRDEITRNHFPDSFTGEVYTFVRRPHNGFANFAIASLKIENGIVKSVTLSDPYAGFEAVSRMDILNSKMIEGLRRDYPAGYRSHV